MSLINDALKRANQVPPPPQQIDTSEWVPADPEQNKPSNLPLIILPLALIVVVALAGFFLVRGFGRKETVQARALPQSAAPQWKPAANQSVVNSPPISQPVAPADISAPATIQAAPEPSVPVAAVTNAAPAVASTAPAAAPAAPQKPSKTRVEAIFYKPRNPAAVINSKLVHVGESIDDAKVVAINKDSVTIEQDGSRKVLTLF